MRYIVVGLIHHTIKRCTVPEFARYSPSYRIDLADLNSLVYEKRPNNIHRLNINTDKGIYYRNYRTKQEAIEECRIIKKKYDLLTILSPKVK